MPALDARDDTIIEMALTEDTEAIEGANGGRSSALYAERDFDGGGGGVDDFLWLVIITEALSGGFAVFTY